MPSAWLRCAWLRGYAILHDFRQLVCVPSFSDIRDIAEMFVNMDFLRRHPAAFVFGSTMVYGIGKIFSVIANSQGARTKVFRDIDAAREWLALPEMTQSDF